MIICNKGVLVHSIVYILNITHISTHIIELTSTLYMEYNRSTTGGIFE